MEIQAIAYLKYHSGEGMPYWEGLDIVVNFKDKGKLFKRKVTAALASERDIEGRIPDRVDCRFRDYDEYYNYVEDIIKDKEFLEEVAIDLVKRYFKDKSKNQNISDRKNAVSKLVEQTPVIKVNVTIK
jgi:hypothetical protein